MKLYSGFLNGRAGVFGLLVLLVALTFPGPTRAAAPKEAEDPGLKKLTANIHWLRHDSFRIDGEGVVIYLDPTRSRKGPRPT